MTTIKTTIKKEIGSIKLPKDVELKFGPTYIEIYVYPDIAHFFKANNIIEELKKILANYCPTVIDNWYLHLSSNNLNIERIDRRSYNIWKFYEEVEEEIEVTSLGHGIAILKDIFPNG